MYVIKFDRIISARNRKRRMKMFDLNQTQKAIASCPKIEKDKSYKLSYQFKNRSC